jgi:DnaJ like chaperone protein
MISLPCFFCEKSIFDKILTMTKWLAALLGFIFFRFPGAVAGYFLGSFVDMLQSGKKGRSFGSFTSQRPVTSQDFELHLLSLCAVVIKADGQVSPAEKEFVKRYFIQTYGQQRANAIFRTFNDAVDKKDLSLENLCQKINQRAPYELKLQLLHFLFNIAKADGHVSAPEVSKLEEIARLLRLGSPDFNSIKAMFIEATDGAYTILEVEKTATDAAVKKAYRDMAKKYHPDRVITEDAAIKRGAEEKFKQVQKAYEAIQKERGM